MGGGTASNPTIPAIFNPLISASVGQEVRQQQANPIGGYNAGNPMGVQGLTPSQQAAMGYTLGNLQMSPLEALEGQAVQRMAGMAGTGPLTGTYDTQGEMGLQDWMSLLNPAFGQGGDIGNQPQPSTNLNAAQGSNVQPQQAQGTNYGNAPSFQGGFPSSPPLGNNNSPTAYQSPTGGTGSQGFRPPPPPGTGGSGAPGGPSESSLANSLANAIPHESASNPLSASVSGGPSIRSGAATPDASPSGAGLASIDPYQGGTVANYGRTPNTGYGTMQSNEIQDLPGIINTLGPNWLQTLRNSPQMSLQGFGQATGGRHEFGGNPLIASAQNQAGWTPQQSATWLGQGLLANNPTFGQGAQATLAPGQQGMTAQQVANNPWFQRNAPGAQQAASNAVNANAARSGSGS
jgi:hypothetical protein